MPKVKSAGTVLFISQVFPPDPASVGQHMCDLGKEMSFRGYRVVALAANRGYDDPLLKYPKRERKGLFEIRRFPFSSFGKKSLAYRLGGQVLFTIQAALWGLVTPNLKGIVVSTIPPFAPLAALLINFIRRSPIFYWVMDINPDEALAMGLARSDSWMVRGLDILNRVILQKAKSVVVLDGLMADHLNKKIPLNGRLHVLPPWPHNEISNHVDSGSIFRSQHGLAGKFVVMYSGNHCLVHPMKTVLDAARILEHQQEIIFVFVGGGVGKKDVEARVSQGATNIVSLPYQPLEKLCESLSAADIHLVVMGDNMAGIVHPCKIYGAMAAARPILFIGPQPSHVTDILEMAPIGCRVAHGEAESLAQTILDLSTKPDTLKQWGANAQQLVRTNFSKEVLCSKMADLVLGAVQQDS